jgi:hypothetical protein
MGGKMRMWAILCLMTAGILLTGISRCGSSAQILAAAQCTVMLTVDPPGGGTITPETTPGTWTGNCGTYQMFTITPAAGYQTDTVSFNGSPIGAPPTFGFVVNSNVTLHALFALNQFMITASAGAGGAITPSGAVSVAPGADQSFTFLPDAGYELGDVVADGASRVLVTPLTFTFLAIAEDHAITASFVPTSSHYNGLFTYIYGFPIGTKPNTCQLCHYLHRTLPVSSLVNSYGTAYKDQRLIGRTRYQSYKALETADSDGDGYTNIQEISAGKWPGDAADHP